MIEPGAPWAGGGLFVTGTDTGVGKTVVSAILTLGLEASYWKPIQAGTEPATDTERVQRWTQLPDSRFFPEAYRLREPASPHAAAAMEGLSIEARRIVAPALAPGHSLIVEGAGGLMVPLNEDMLIIDLIGALAFPVVLVARTSLGTLNHTLLSLAELRRREIAVAGVILNGDRHVANAAAIERYGEVRILGRVPPRLSLDPPSLREAFGRLRISRPPAPAESP